MRALVIVRLVCAGCAVASALVLAAIVFVARAAELLNAGWTQVAPGLAQPTIGLAPSGLLLVSALLVLASIFFVPRPLAVAGFAGTTVATAMITASPEQFSPPVVVAWSACGFSLLAVVLSFAREGAWLVRTGAAAVAVVVAVTAVTWAHHDVWPQQVDHRSGRARIVAFFSAHRTEFAEAADLARRPGYLTGYPGVRLPDRLCVIAASCRMSNVATDASPSVVAFVPVETFVPDDAVGLAHFDGSPFGAPFDGYGTDICPRYEVGDGWWWLDRPATAAARARVCR